MPFVVNHPQDMPDSPCNLRTIGQRMRIASVVYPGYVCNVATESEGYWPYAQVFPLDRAAISESNRLKIIAIVFCIASRGTC